MGHLEMGGDTMGYQNYAGYKREENKGLSPRFNIFVSLKHYSTKFCILIEKKQENNFYASLVVVTP